MSKECALDTILQEYLSMQTLKVMMFADLENEIRRPKQVKHSQYDDESDYEDANTLIDYLNQYKEDKIGQMKKELEEFKQEFDKNYSKAINILQLKKQKKPETKTRHIISDFSFILDPDPET